MGLPKIEHPLFTLEIPSTNEKVQYRPFTVKEEKILLIAQESQDLDQIILAIKQIIGNCFEKIDVDSLSTFDLEYLLLKLRTVSVGNEITLNFVDEETKESVELQIDTNDIEIKKYESHKQLIDVDSNIMIKLAYPKINSLDFLRDELTDEERQNKLFDVMMGSIDQVISGEEVYQLKDFSEAEVNDFINSLSSKTIADIKSFFETMPKVRIEKEYKVGDKKKTFIVEGTETFFM